MHRRRRVRSLPAIGLAIVAAVGTASAAELKPKTAEAFDRYVSLTGRLDPEGGARVLEVLTRSTAAGRQWTASPICAARRAATPMPSWRR